MKNKNVIDMLWRCEHSCIQGAKKMFAYVF